MAAVGQESSPIPFVFEADGTYETTLRPENVVNGRVALRAYALSPDLPPISSNLEIVRIQD